jgi:hypothetical protein
MKLLIGVVGALAAMLGTLWLLQGLGAVHMRPILCVADCAPIQGSSPTWAVIGGVVAVIGVLAVVYAVRRPRRSNP